MEQTECEWPGRILLRQVQVMDSQQDGLIRTDVLVSDGVIARMGAGLEGMADMAIDGEGLWLLPGLIDLHCHLREPGGEAKETIASGTRAAAAGGYTQLVAMANLNPVPDSVASYQDMKQRIDRDALIPVWQAAAISKNLDGKELVDFAALAQSGAKIFTDDGNYIDDAALLYQALIQGQNTNAIISLHEEITTLKKSSFAPYHPMNEAAAIARDLEILRHAGGRMHLQHVSLQRSVELIRMAKEQGLAVTAEVCPHHLVLTAECLPEKQAQAKMAPPLRTQEDVEALLVGLDAGIIDLIATDHAPHTLADKDKEFDQAANGIIGLETAWPVLYTELVKGRGFSVPWLVERMSTRPARIFGLSGGSLAAGLRADLCLVDPTQEWVIAKEDFVSRSCNSPFIGQRVSSRIIGTAIAGRFVYTRPELLARVCSQK